MGEYNKESKKKLPIYPTPVCKTTTTKELTQQQQTQSKHFNSERTPLQTKNEESHTLTYTKLHNTLTHTNTSRIAARDDVLTIPYKAAYAPRKKTAQENFFILFLTPSRKV